MINIKSSLEVEIMRDANKIVAEVLNKLKKIIKPGLSTVVLDDKARYMVKKHNARAAFLGYRGYPAAICVSINEEVVHGIPRKDKIIKEGDIVSLDFGVEYKGYYGDAAITVGVGKISEIAQKLIDVTREALYKGIENAKENNFLGDISNSIQTYAEANGFSVVRDFVGHGIGKNLHEEPMVPNFGKKGEGPKLREGFVLAIEPMINEKGYEVIIDGKDNWTVKTLDGGLSAHFEHTVLITKNGPEILTEL